MNDAALYQPKENYMTATFEKCTQSAQVWVDEIMHRLGWDHPDKAVRALRAVLHALRDRLGVDEVAHLGAQLPQLVRGIYYEGWHPAGKPLRMHREDFIDHVKKEFQNDLAVSIPAICRAVLGTLQGHISKGEMDKVRACLPEDLRDLWP